MELVSYGRTNYCNNRNRETEEKEMGVRKLVSSVEHSEF